MLHWRINQKAPTVHGYGNRSFSSYTIWLACPARTVLKANTKRGVPVWDVELGVQAYLRGMAYLKSKQGAEAAAEFQKVLDHRGASGASPYCALASWVWRGVTR